jgi:very-short-patch-repair endonuclease
MRERDASLALGVSRRGIQILIETGTIRRLRRGVIVGACIVERATNDRQLAHAIALRTLLLSFEDCYASHESAAFLLDLPLLELPAYGIGTRERGAWRSGKTFRVRIAPLPAHHLAIGLGERSTAVARTVIDIARSSSFRAAVVVGDAAIRDRCDPATLGSVLDECATWADVGKARTALGFLDGRSESAFESVSRAILHEHQLPPPELQVEVDAGGRVRYRLDFFWKDRGVVGEADGLIKYNDPQILRAEKVRQERLERLGLTVVRWTWREMLVETDETIARIRCALRQ